MGSRLARRAGRCQERGWAGAFSVSRVSRVSAVVGERLVALVITL
jgi:hypothetical protein